MDEQLLSALAVFGSEAKIFQAVLNAGKATPATLGKMSGIKRTTAYHLARVLVQKGLLIEDVTKRPRVFSPASPQDIQSLIESEQRRFRVREKNLQRLSTQLSRTVAEEKYPVPEIRFVEEEKLEKFLYTETPRWHKSIMGADATWWGFQDHTFIDKYAKITDWYWRRAKEPLTVKLLSNQSITEKRVAGKYPRRSIKFWPKNSSFLSTTWVIGDYVVMVNTRLKPFYLVEIHDLTLAHDLREVFKNLWELVR